MVVVDVGVSVAMDVQVDQAMACDLIQHMVQKGHAGIDGLAASAIQIDGNSNTGFVRIPGNVSSTHGRDLSSRYNGG